MLQIGVMVMVMVKITVLSLGSEYQIEDGGGTPICYVTDKRDRLQSIAPKERVVLF